MTQRFSLAVLVCLCPALGWAQDVAPGGVSFSLGLDQDFEATTDRDLSTDGADDGWDSTTRLSFGAVTQTRSERLALDLGAVLRGSQDGTEPGDRSAALSYSRTSADATFESAASWRQVDISYLSDLALISDGDLDALTSDGTRTTTDMDLLLRWGDTAPLGYSLSLSHQVVRYDAASSSLTDTSSTTLGAGVRMDLDAVTTADLDLRYRLSDDQGSPVEERTSLTGTLTFDRPLGALTARMNAVRDDSGTTRWAASLARALALPRTEWTARLGLAQDDAGDARLTGELGYRYALPEGAITLSAAETLAAGDETRTTTLSAGLDQALTPLSRLSLDFDYARARDITDGDDVATGSLSASYGVSLTRDWQLNVGARANLRDDAGSRSRGNTVFIGLDRSLTWKP